MTTPFQPDPIDVLFQRARLAVMEARRMQETVKRSRAQHRQQITAIFQQMAHFHEVWSLRLETLRRKRHPPLT